MAFLFIGLLMLILIAVAGLLARNGSSPSSSPRAAATWMPARIVTYALAFAALVACLYALATLLALALAFVTGQIGKAISRGDARDRASLALAALIVGLPIWLLCWGAARRRLARLPIERDTWERRLCFAAVFALTSIVALFALQDLLQALFTLPAPARERPPVMHTIDAAGSIAVYGPAWLAFALLGWRERKPRVADAMHDLALVVLACYAIGFLWHGLFDALHQIVSGLVGQPRLGEGSASARSSWATWGEIFAWLLSGGGFWLAFLRYDLARGGRRLMRVLYLYAVWLLAASITVVVATEMIYELLRRLWGYRPSDGVWLFLTDLVPWLLPAGLICAVHWCIMRFQAGLNTARMAVPGEIAWPRRPGLALQSFAGLGMLVAGVLGLLWLAIDALCGTLAAAAGPAWWRDRLSAGLATALVGLLLWLAAWRLLQGAVAAAPTQERTARARRTLLSSVVLLSALTALGFAIAVVWLLVRALLGEGLDIAARAQALQYFGTVLVTGTVAAAHGLLLREDQRWQPRQVPRLRLSVLIEDGATDMLPALAALPGVQVELIGQVRAAQFLPGQDFHALASRLAELPDRDRLAGAVLVLGPASCTIYPYTKGAGATAGEQPPPPE